VFLHGQGDWVKKYDEDGLVIYLKGKKTNEYRAEMIVDAPVIACIGLMRDISEHSKFMGGVKKASVLKEYNQMESLIYCEIDMPFPMSNNEIVTRAKFEVLEKGAVRIILKAEPHLYPKTKLTRLNLADGFWLFEPQVGNKTKVTYQLKFEDSNAPNWLANYFILDGPKKTMTGFAKRVKKDKYKDIVISWL
jgi:ribosome-associated toxin RatA of RatAB toxin-antitoxin module